MASQRNASKIVAISFTSAAILAGAGLGCTGQIPGQFRLKQADEHFSSSQNVNTKLDMLWVVDNSASMDISQQRLRDGFRSFAAKYMKPDWDIRVAVITTDTYMANPAFSGQLNATYQAAGYKSNYLAGITSGGIAGRTTPFVNPSYAPSLINTTPGVNLGTFTSGSTTKQNWPLWANNWSKLLPGNHDGPMTTLCYEGNAYFFKGVANCRIRDDQTANTGVSHCLNPTGAESSTTQCINTTMNDTIHSGKAYISTMPPAGTAANAAWTNQLVNDFLINLSPGASGSGSERGWASVQQLLLDNETNAPTVFFRPGSLRVIVMVSDEDDQTMTLPSPVPGGFTSNTNYSSSCASKTVDGYSYTLSVCADPTKLTPLATIKAQMDTFFSGLDATPENPSPVPNYFVISIVALNGQSIQQLHTDRCTEEMALFGTCSTSVDRGDRYIGMGTLVGNGSMAMDINASSYAPLLDSIGLGIVQKKSVFNLTRAPTGMEEIIVLIKHANGSSTAVKPSQYKVEGKVLTITDYNFMLSLSSTDAVSISYQPSSVF
jgi:hypothetical protein